MNTIKYHNKFGKVTVISSDETFTIVITENGEEKKLMTKYSTLQDVPFAEEEMIKPIVKKAKKLNPANHMSAKTWAESKYSTMSKSDFEEERNNDKWASKSL